MSGSALGRVGTPVGPSHGLGAAFLLAAVVCFSVMDITVKHVGNLVPILMVLWVRYLFQAVMTTAIMLPQRGLALLRTHHPKFHLLRGLLLLACSLFSFSSLKFMPVAEITAIAMLTPLAVTFLAATVLGEPVSRLRWLLVAGGFAGAMFIVRPGGGVLGWYALLPLCMVSTYAWFQILTSKLAQTDDAATMHFYTGWIGTLCASLVVPFFWVTVDAPSTWGYLLLVASMATLGHLLLIFAYARASAISLTPYGYSQILIAMLGGWLIFNHLPDAWALFGMALIALCGVAGGWLSAREGRAAL